jgi:hypothetical protein
MDYIIEYFRSTDMYIDVTIKERINYLKMDINSYFIHSVFCLTTGPKPPLKRFLHIVRSRASSFK